MIHDSEHEVIFPMSPRISIRACVGRSVRRSVGPSVRPSVSNAFVKNARKSFASPILSLSFNALCLFNAIRTHPWPLGLVFISETRLCCVLKIFLFLSPNQVLTFLITKFRLKNMRVAVVYRRPKCLNNLNVFRRKNGRKER